MNSFKSLFLLGALVYGSDALATEKNFNIKLNLLEPVAITEIQSLSFTSSSTIQNDNISTSTNDGVVADIEITGLANSSVTTTIVEDHLNLQDRQNKTRLTLSNWKFEGDLIDIGGAGKATTSSTQLLKLRLGASSNFDSNSTNGNYIGSATLLVVYQ